MMDTLVQHAPVAGLLLFFGVFVVIVVWALAPSRKKMLESYGSIPLKEE